MVARFGKEFRGFKEVPCEAKEVVVKDISEAKVCDFASVFIIFGL